MDKVKVFIVIQQDRGIPYAPSEDRLSQILVRFSVAQN